MLLMVKYQQYLDLQSLRRLPETSKSLRLIPDQTSAVFEAVTVPLLPKRSNGTQGHPTGIR